MYKDFGSALLGIMLVIVVGLLIVNPARNVVKYDDGPPCDNVCWHGLQGHHYYSDIVQDYWDVNKTCICTGDNDTRKTQSVDVLCPANTTVKEIVCGCAKNTSTPCMEYCYECEK